MSHPTSRRMLLGATLVTVLSLPVLAQQMTHTMPMSPATVQKTAQKSTHQSTQKTAQKSTGTLPLKATDATVVAVPPMIKETSVFGTLTNTGKRPIVLNGVRATAAGHGMLMVTEKSADGMLGMSMAETLTIPAGGKLVLSDTGDHLMLTKLKRPLRVGEMLTLTLSATDGRTFTLKATVRKP